MVQGRRVGNSADAIITQQRLVGASLEPSSVHFDGNRLARA